MRSHLAGVNERGKSATRIASAIAEGAARNKNPSSAKRFLTYTAASNGCFCPGTSVSPTLDVIQFTRIDGLLGVSGPAVVILVQQAITRSAYNALMFGMAQGAVSRAAVARRSLGSPIYPRRPVGPRREGARSDASKAVFFPHLVANGLRCNMRSILPGSVRIYGRAYSRRFETTGSL